VRIVRGKWAGRKLVSPGGRVRPTAEDLRDLWLTELGDVLPGARVLDLYAGTGALGLEALSRGAVSADFVENGGAALHALKANLAALRVKGRTRLFKKDVFRFLEGIGSQGGSDREPGNQASAAKDAVPRTAAHREPPYDLALADPPYTSRAAHGLATLWLERPFSRILSVEHAFDTKLPGRPKRKVLGDSCITTYWL
jgi:16S rRNA (guanine966-N2)-methyltransferase